MSREIFKFEFFRAENGKFKVLNSTSKISIKDNPNILGHPLLYYSRSQPRYSDHPDIREINPSNRCFLHSIDCKKQHQGNKYFTID